MAMRTRLGRQLGFLAIGAATALLSAFLLHAKSPKNSNGIISGKDFSFYVKPPAGWMLDLESGKPQGHCAVFCLQGSTWQEGVTVMYANASPKLPGQTLDSFIEADLKPFQASAPTLKIRTAPPVVTSDQKTASIREFGPDSHGNYESVAYIEEPSVFVVLVMTSRHLKGWKDEQPAFRGMVQSYRYIDPDKK